MSGVTKTKKRLPDRLAVGDLAMQAAVAVGVVEFADYVEITAASRPIVRVVNHRIQVSDLRYHFPVTLCTLAADEKCTIMPDQIVRNYSVRKSAIRTNIQATRILFRDSGFGNDVTLTWQPRSDMFSDDCWLVEQVPYVEKKALTLDDVWDSTFVEHHHAKVTAAVAAFSDATRDKILLDTKAGKP